jgi:hypothetical protein
VQRCIPICGEPTSENVGSISGSEYDFELKKSSLMLP